MTVETPPSPPPEPITETIEGPPEQAKFSWDAPDPRAEPSETTPAPPLGSLDALAYGAISGLHASLAELTGWEGWRFTAADEDAWRALLKPMLASLDPKKWRLAFALVGIAMLEAGRIVGYIRFRRAHAAPPRPKVATPARPEADPSVGEVPIVPLGKPLEHAGDGL